MTCPRKAGAPGRERGIARAVVVYRKRAATKGRTHLPAFRASFATYYYHCDQIGAPQELTDEAGRIVWAAGYKVWGQTQPLQYLRTGTDDAAVFTHDQRPLALAARCEVQSLALVEQPLRFQGQYFDGETGLY